MLAGGNAEGKLFSKRNLLPYKVLHEHTAMEKLCP